MLYSRLRRWSATRPFDLHLAVEIFAPGFWGEYGFTVASRKEGNFRVKHEFCRAGESAGAIEHEFRRDNGRISNLRSGKAVESGLELVENTALALPFFALRARPFRNIRVFLRSMSFFEVFPNTIRTPQKPSASKVLSDTGDNLATILRMLLRRSRTKDLVAALNKVVGGGITNLRVEPVGGFLVTQLEHDMGGGNKAWFDLSQESDGTLRMLGMLAALYHQRRQGFLAMEEPEIALREDDNRDARLCHVSSRIIVQRCQYFA